GDTEVLLEGERYEAADALAAVQLEPFTVEAKEGLALTNGTSFMSAFACLTVGAARELADLTDLLTAMASEALHGNRSHFNAFLFDDAKPHRGTVASAGNIRTILADSHLALDGEELFGGPMNGDGYLELDRQVQDKYSIRCAPHVNGVLRDVLAWVGQWVETEINSSDDNPLFDVDGQCVQSGGLPPNLIPRFDPAGPEAGLHHGFKGMQLCCSAMTAEAMKLSNPATIHSRSTECHNQDKVSMGAIAARDARSIVEIAQNIAAIHVIAACQALELRGIDEASAPSRAAFDMVRERVPFLDGDRRMDRDIRAV